MSDLDAYYAALGQVGRERATPPRNDGYTVDEVLRGISPDGGKYPLRILLAVYLKAKNEIHFTEGDTVKVHPQYAAGPHGNGWVGYEQMFADETAVVNEVKFSPLANEWFATIRYYNPYRWSDWQNKMFHDDKPASFVWAVDRLIRVEANVGV